MKTRRTGFVIALLLCCLPATAQANAGTVVIFAVMLHLVIGNTFIGLLEGLILWRGFGTRKVRSVWVMILANYFSAWAGMLHLSFIRTFVYAPDLYTVSRDMWLMIIYAYLITLVLEWPFVAFCFRGDKHWLKRSVTASLVIQTVSYAALIFWYSYAGHESTLHKAATPVPIEEITLPEGFSVYYISRKGREVYRRDLNSGQSERVGAAGEAYSEERLQFLRVDGDEGQWELQVARGRDPEGRVVATLPTDLVEEIPEPLDRGDGSGPDRRVVPRVGDARKSPWELQLQGPHSTIGIGGTDTNDGRTVCLEYQTFLAQWFARSATHLPGDLVLFQFGEDQICVWDVPNRKLAIWGRGQEPIVVGHGRDREKSDAPVPHQHSGEERP